MIGTRGTGWESETGGGEVEGGTCCGEFFLEDAFSISLCFKKTERSGLMFEDSDDGK